MRYRYFIAIVGFLLVAASCASHKKIVTPSSPQTFEWLIANVDVQAEGNGLSFDDLSGQIRMRKDSIVWISMTAIMGVEVLRVKVDTDSVWIINRLEKSYIAEPLDSLSAQLDMPLSLPLVQALLLDNNEGVPPVENQIVQLNTFAFGKMSAKVRYNKIRLNEETTFPLRITDKMERYRLPKKR